MKLGDSWDRLEIVKIVVYQSRKYKYGVDLPHTPRIV